MMNFEDDGFTISPNFVIMDELEYQSMLRQLNERKKLIFDDIIYKKKKYYNISIHIFLARRVINSKSFTLKSIIQRSLWIYNKYLSINLTKIKASLMVSISKFEFNIDGQTIHLTFLTNINKYVKLSSDSLKKFTCRYELLQLVLIDQMFPITIKMFNVIDHQLRQ